MKLLLDTHLLVWALQSPSVKSSRTISALTMQLLQDPASDLCFSSAAVWEVAIKNSQGRPDFEIDPHLFRRALLDSDYVELPITSAHTAAVGELPLLHRDPFDRILIAQAIVEGMMLLTSDARILRYSGPIRRA